MHDESKSFLIFIIFILVTFLTVTFTKELHFALGILGVLWGAFGFFRLIHLSSNQYKNLPKIVSLPAQILFGLAQQQDKKITTILQRLAQADVILWVCGGVVFVLFALFCSFFPTEISVIKTLHLKQEILVDFPIQNQTDMFAVMEGLSFYGIAAIVIYCALSFSQSSTNIRWAIYSLLPVFIIAAIYIFAFLPVADVILWPDLKVLKGGGLGQANIMDVLLPKMMGESGTGLTRRFTELGASGAYGVYILFIPAFVVLVRALFDRNNIFFKPLIGLSCLFLMAVLDALWISAPIIQGLMMMGLCLVSLCWGSVMSQKQVFSPIT